MALQLLNLSTPDDRKGDDFRAGGVKINANFTEIFALVGADDAVYVSKEADFPTQDSSTITLDANTPFIPTASFSTSKQFIPKDGSSMPGRSIDSHQITFTGSGAMFAGTDVDFLISNVGLKAGASNQAFNFIDNVGGVKKFICSGVQLNEGTKWGTFEKMDLVDISKSNAPSSANIGNGIELKGVINTLSLDDFALSSSSATFKGVDLGTSSITIPRIENLNFNAPFGAFGISGLAVSGNIPVGSLATVSGCVFAGGMTDLENITVSSVRFNFRDNFPTSDTFPDALLSFRNNVTETVIAVVDTPVIVNAVWGLTRFSLFTVSATGRAIYEAERDLTAPITISAGLISSGGGAIDVTVYVAINGSIVSASGIQISISGSSAQTLAIPWQETLSEDDFVEIFVENNTNTTNIIVESSIMRVR